MEEPAEERPAEDSELILCLKAMTGALYRIEGKLGEINSQLNSISNRVRR